MLKSVKICKWFKPILNSCFKHLKPFKAVFKICVNRHRCASPFVQEPFYAFRMGPAETEQTDEDAEDGDGEAKLGTVMAWHAERQSIGSQTKLFQR